MTADKRDRTLDPDRLLDEALEETFPASDPISPGVGPGQPVPNVGDGDSDSSGPVTLDPFATWDGRHGLFRIPVHGCAEFACLAIEEKAPLPLLEHLDATAHDRTTALGAGLHERLQSEIDAAIARGAHQVATGITLLTHAQLTELG